MASRSGDDDRLTVATQPAPPALPGTASSGEVLQCPGGGQAETFFSLVGSEFRMVGRLASVDSNQLLVKGPEQYVKLNIAQNAKIDGALAGGQIVKASGNFDDNGDAQATDVHLACRAPIAVVAITAAPTAFPFTPEPTATSAPEPVVVVKTPKPKPVAVVASSDDDDDPTPRPTRQSNSGQSKPARTDDDDDHKPSNDKRDKPKRYSDDDD